MFIVTRIGESINEYRLLCDRYFPEVCPTCSGDRIRQHGHYMHSAGDQDPVPVFRFRCKRRGCRQVFTVLPDLFEPRQSIPVQTQEQAVFQYAATLQTASQAAETAGVSASTVWRWVERASAGAPEWVAQMQNWLHSVHPGTYVAVAVDETLRPRWLSRRLRLAEKVTRLLLLEYLPVLVKRCRRTAEELLRLHRAPVVQTGWPPTCLGFCWRILPGLVG